MATTSYTQPQENLQPVAQTNPTQVTQNTKSFGADQFAVEPFAQPFPFDQQSQESAAFRQRFGDWLGSQETPAQTRENLENRYGYQDLTENYLRTKEAGEDVMSAIRATPENVLSRGSETIMTQAQLSNITNKEVGDLMKTYTQLGQLNEQQGRRLAIVEQNMNTAAKLEMAQQQKMMTPWLQEYQDNSVMQAREFTGWSFASQLELNRLIGNRDAGLQWTNAESNRAHALSMQENAFQNSLEFMEKENEYAIEFWE